MDYESQGYPRCPEQCRLNPLNILFQLQRNETLRKQYYSNTFCKLSLLPNGEFKGEPLLVYVRGLLASDGIPSLLESVLHFR